jgi:hypothetical protein
MSNQPTGRQLLALAREGDLEPLLHLCDIDGDGEGDILAYKWLNVASDFGHAGADDMIDDVMEVSSLRYDDDNSVTGGVHFDLHTRWSAATRPGSRAATSWWRRREPR